MKIKVFESYKILKEEKDVEEAQPEPELKSASVPVQSKKTSIIWPITVTILSLLLTGTVAYTAYTVFWNQSPTEVLNFEGNTDDPANNRPIIGVLTQEYYPNHTYTSHPTLSYIPASYVKLVEGSGGRVVPIHVFQNESYYEKMFSKINGLLLPGGEINLNNSGYSTAGQIMLKLARASFDRTGDYFPVFGECQGLQFLPFEVLKMDVIDNCHAWNMSTNLNFTKKAATSRMFGSAPKDILSLLAHTNGTVNFHHRCISQNTFDQHNLGAYYNILSWSTDPVTKIPFVSSMEAVKYPFYGIQFHPEKNLYEWNEKVATTHTKTAIRTAQYFGNFLINEARKSTHKFSSKAEEDSYLIYNHAPTFTGIQQTSLATFEAFEQRYFIPINV